MTRRKMLLMTGGATVLGLAALVGFADQNAIFANDDDDEGQEKLIKLLDTSKINLQQGLAASEQQGQPISAKFEVDEGKLQLSVYTAKDGKFSEVLVDYTNGKVMKAEPITEGDDLAAAKSQSATMAKAKTTLKDAVDKAAAQSAKIRVVSAAPSLKDGRPVVSIAFLDGEQMKTVQQPLD
ncbi:PepSY domain-containing protein [Bradyrhizobium sp. Ash2021]|uniref:PepSY domain-containing protein n=1 Tax=Bradyrhizobium sp. Ash2021 TaxID=2954771 RepID=UPI0028149E97|nr:PepSY domain-containing protein [Bradyrhizobium sp. Ash2021]WMT71446.1 PepSY domain-containing protein [Bradyrhizobium sp. Ash2021]